LNELDAAAMALETAIKIDPASPYAYNNLGRVYWRQRKYEEAAAQFRKQIVINPQDQYAHANLGMMLRDQKKCSEAMRELEAALALTPNHTEALLAEGECDIDLGNRTKGISELEQATSVSSTPGIWNSAAYSLAKRGIELERAEKWSDTSLMIESARLHRVSLERLAPEQLGGVLALAHYWDTRGWIYFQRGDYANAQTYTAAAWWLHPLPVIGNHLGQIYEKPGQTETAIRTYAMAVAAAERPTRSSIDPDDAADAKQRLARLAGPDANLPSLIARGRTDLEAMTAISIPNAAKSSGSADFTLRVATTQKSAAGATDFRQRFSGEIYRCVAVGPSAASNPRS
jgi:tetratricopeptide (TPR) repeat protein